MDTRHWTALNQNWLKTMTNPSLPVDLALPGSWRNQEVLLHWLGAQFLRLLSSFWSWHFVEVMEICALGWECWDLGDASFRHSNRYQRTTALYIYIYIILIYNKLGRKTKFCTRISLFWFWLTRSPFLLRRAKPLPRAEFENSMRQRWQKARSCPHKTLKTPQMFNRVNYMKTSHPKILSFNLFEECLKTNLTSTATLWKARQSSRFFWRQVSYSSQWGARRAEDADAHATWGAGRSHIEFVLMREVSGFRGKNLQTNWRWA